MVSRITFFPVSNGDSTLIEHSGKTILTDVNYRANCEDDDEPEYDFAPDLQEACHRGRRDYRLSLFPLTHPDRDHLGGFTKLFYTGDPNRYADRPRTDDKLILVEEMWVSPYTINPHYPTDASAPVFAEVRRRRSLMGTAAGRLDGNRLRVLDTRDAAGTFAPGIAWRLLAPTPQEAAIPEAPEGEDPTSTNNSSLVIQWSLDVDGGITELILAGDAEVEVWERLWRDHGRNPIALRRHILLAPHHCSRGSMARKVEEDHYEYSAAALAALGQANGIGFIVASSKPIKNDDDNPPSWDARLRYLQMLRNSGASNPESRFLNPETHLGGKPDPVVFDLSRHGPSLRVPGTSARGKSALGVSATSAPVYG